MDDVRGHVIATAAMLRETGLERGDRLLLAAQLDLEYRRSLSRNHVCWVRGRAAARGAMFCGSKDLRRSDRRKSNLVEHVTGE